MFVLTFPGTAAATASTTLAFAPRRWLVVRAKVAVDPLLDLSAVVRLFLLAAPRADGDAVVAGVRLVTSHVLTNKRYVDCHEAG